MVRDQVQKCKELKLPSSSCKLPYMYPIPKFHKPELKHRFVVSYADCCVKPIAQKLTLGLKAVQYQIQRYCRMMYILTGINRYWIISNNTPILNFVDKINDKGSARNIETYDFTTLYTNLALADMKSSLKEVIKLAFKHSKRSHISVYEKGFSWVNKPGGNTFSYTESSLVECLEWLLDNSYLCVGNLIFRQIMGVPIGVDCGPYVANLCLFYYENIYISSLVQRDYGSARKLNGTFRLMDDISSLNSDGVFSICYPNIYPNCLTLNKENVGDISANVLDLDLSILNGNINCSVYDKRDNFNFNIVRFAHISSDISKACAYGIFTSQIIRYFRICNHLDSFLYRVKLMFKTLVDLGYKESVLTTKFNSIVTKYSMNLKFPNLNFNLVTHTD